MKNFSLILNILLVAVLLVFAIKSPIFGNKEAVEVPAAQTNSKDAMEVIMTRSSVRAYSDKPVEKEKLEKLLKAAMAAPTGGNKQPWAFVVVQEQEVLDKLAAIGPSGAMIAKAPMAIVVCGDLTKTFEGPASEYWIQDGSAATENLLLAAHALDLGAVWVGVYPKEPSVTKVKEILSLPEHVMPLNIIPVGYPLGEGTPKDKWAPEKVHYNIWK